MVCKVCKANNHYRVNYCQLCGNAFTLDDHAEDYNKTFFGVLDKIDEGYKKLTLAVITDTIWFKIILLVAVLAVGIWTYFMNGAINEFRVIPGDDYELEYNKIDDEYYLYTDEKSVSLALYIPENIEEITEKVYDESKVKISDEKIDLDELDDAIVIDSGHRIELKAKNRKGEKTTVTVIAYREEVGLE